MRVRDRVRELVVKAAVKLAVFRGVCTEEQGQEVLEKFETSDWQEFFEWLLEHWPEIMEMIMAFLPLFM